MIVIDGSFGEGGGQILRMSIGIAAALGKPIKIINIRAKRKNPGLQRQHLTAIKILQTITDAEVHGLELGSREVVFIPRTLRGGRYRFDIGTAGSITLVIQALLPVLPFLPQELELEIRGGTDVPWSPPIDFVRFVLLRHLEPMGYRIYLELRRRGHYPRGGGIVRLRSEPSHRIVPIERLERGELVRIGGRSHCVRLPGHVAERQANAARELLEKLGVPVEIDIEWYEPEKDPHLGPGSGIVLYAEFEKTIIGSDSLGAKGKRAEVVGREAAEKLLEEIESGATVDRHAGDMLIPLASLACGKSRFKISRLTMHAYTMIEIVRKIVGASIEAKPMNLDEPSLVEIEGICLER